jgi:hypothetical protein
VEREKVLAVISRLLNSDDGQLLMDELEAVWNDPRRSLMGEDPQSTAYLVGKRDAYMLMETLAEKRDV